MKIFSQSKGKPWIRPKEVLFLDTGLEEWGLPNAVQPVIQILHSPPSLWSKLFVIQIFFAFPQQPQDMDANMRISPSQNMKRQSLVTDFASRYVQT